MSFSLYVSFSPSCCGPPVGGPPKIWPCRRRRAVIYLQAEKDRIFMSPVYYLQTKNIIFQSHCISWLFFKFVQSRFISFTADFNRPHVILVFIFSALESLYDTFYTFHTLIPTHLCPICFSFAARNCLSIESRFEALMPHYANEIFIAPSSLPHALIAAYALIAAHFA